MTRDDGDVLNVCGRDALSFQVALEQRRVIDLLGRVTLLRAVRPVLVAGIERSAKGLLQRMQGGWRDLSPADATARLELFVSEIDQLESSYLDGWSDAYPR
jgi:hypothetical protein